MKRLQTTLALIFSVLGIEKLPQTSGQVSFSDDQKEKLLKELGQKDYDSMIAAINKELKTVQEDAGLKAEIEKAKAEFHQVLKEQGYNDYEIESIASTTTAENEDKTAAEALANFQKEVKAYQKKTDSLIKKLMEEEEPEKELINQNKMNVAHSATHLFGEAKEYNSLERPWNQKAAGLTTAKTDWSDSVQGKANIEKLNGDIDLFYRENPRSVESLFRDMDELPSFWPRRLNVDDKVSDGKIMTDEITQVRKFDWLPKNNQLIQPEVRQIFPVQIDLEWEGYDLQKIETSWLNTLFNREGSQPYKMTFVQFLLTEIMKKARQEDRISSIKGVYVAPVKGLKVPGRAINRQNGLLQQLYRAIYVEKKVKVPSIGEFTFENSVDYVQQVIESNLKEEIKSRTDLVYYLEPAHLRAFKQRYKVLFGTNNDFTKEDMMKIPEYENIRFQPLVDLAGTGVHFITFDDNIEVLENIPNEKGLITFDMQKRQIFGHGDYKMGCGFIHMGTKVADDAPEAFKVQTVWTNGVFPFKNDFFVPAFDHGNGELDLAYSNVHIDSNFKTDITEVKNVYAGQVVRIKGNTLATGALKANAEAFSLAGNEDFDFSTGGTIKLIVQKDFTLREISRTATPDLTPTDLFTFSGNSIDVTDGLNQAFNGSATTLASIDNGVEQQKLTITNTGSANLTVNSIAGKISLTAGAVVKPGDKLVLVYSDGIWIELSRTIA